MVERETSNMGDSIPHSSSSIDDTTTSLTTDDEVPLDKCRLTLLLVSGKRQSFDFDPYTTVDTVKSFIMEHWPQGKTFINYSQKTRDVSVQFTLQVL